MTDTTEIAGIGPDKADRLADAGFESAEDIVAAGWADIAAVEGFAEARSKEIHQKAVDLIGEDDGEGGSESPPPEDVINENQSADDLGDNGAQSDDDPAGPKGTEINSSADEMFPDEKTHEFDMTAYEDVRFHVVGGLADEEVRARKRHDEPTADMIADMEADVAAGGNLELTEDEINRLYTALNTVMTEYQGTPGIPELTARMREFKREFESFRSAVLFS